ncbi:hypothetical protein F4802DRAFT_546596 [Xylaria palmicola]|nr:hypothetical protein F4802DRAFT_546596 [Xylaria palmicola]
MQCGVSWTATYLVYNIVNPKMPASDAAEEPLVDNSFGQDASLDSSKPGKGPVTPELTDRSRFGLPTPDTTPESVRVAPNYRKKQVFVYPAPQRDTGLITPSISSRAPSIEETTNNRGRQSLHSIRSEISEAASEESDRPPTPPPLSYLDEEEESHPSLSFVKSIYTSFVSLLNLAKQRGSRADDARVQDILALIKSLPTIRRTRVGNVTRTLTAKQYGKLLKAIENSEDEAFRACKDSLRFDYTRSKKRFELRMPTTMHGSMEDFIKRRTFRWQDRLEESSDTDISNAAKSIMPSANANVRFPYPRGPSDTKSPDWRIGHEMCERRCTHPTLVMEFGWTQEKKDLQSKAEAYMRRTKGEIRTVVGVFMRDMYLAENRNEKKLEQMYLAGEVENRSYCYWEDPTNETGEASILLWRAKSHRNGSVKAVCFQDEVFRDTEGNAVGSSSLRLPMQDFICKGIVDSPAGKFEAPLLEISARDLCENINKNLQRYRQERDGVVREKAEKEIEKRKQEAAEERSRREKEAKTRAARGRTSTRNVDEGRVRAYGRLVSARLRGQKPG